MIKTLSCTIGICIVINKQYRIDVARAVNVVVQRIRIDCVADLFTFLDDPVTVAVEVNFVATIACFVANNSAIQTNGDVASELLKTYCDRLNSIY